MSQLATMLCSVVMATSALAGDAGPTNAVPVPTLRSEHNERGNYRAQLRNYLRSGNFDELEQIAQTLIKEDPRFSSGISKLIEFYVALEPEEPSLSDGPDARDKTFAAWEKARPDSHWPKVGFSLLESWRAWQARGTGMARNVSQEQWKEFDRHIKLSSEWAERALANDPGDPGLLTHMIDLCRGTHCSQERVEQLLASALAINPKYDAAYVPVAKFLLPRWFGDPDTFVQFAEKASDQNRALGNIVYARIAMIALVFDGDKLIETYPRLSWDRIQDGLRQVDKLYPDSTRTFHLMGRFAYLYQDGPVARQALARLKSGWRAEFEFWGKPEAFKRAYAWALDEPPADF